MFSENLLFGKQKKNNRIEKEYFSEILMGIMKTPRLSKVTLVELIALKFE